MPFPVCREPGQSIRWVFVGRHPGALKRGKCPGEAQSPLSSVYATVPGGVSQGNRSVAGCYLNFCAGP